MMNDKQIIKSPIEVNKKYLCSFFRSVMEDLLSAGDNFVKLHNYQEYKDKNPDSSTSEKQYYIRQAYALNVPVLEKGSVLNQYFVNNFFIPNFKNEYLKSNYLHCELAMKQIINNPDILSDFYIIERTEKVFEVGKIIKIGNLKDGKYDINALDHMYNYDYYSEDTNKKALDRIRRGILTAQLVQTNISWMDNEDDARDSLLVTGAMLECSVSGSTSTFTATTFGNWATINGKPIATAKDDSTINIGSFGHCPARNKECKFSSTSGWQNTDAMSFGGEDTITEKSYIQCANDGTIKVKTSGQDMMITNTKSSKKS